MAYTAWVQTSDAGEIVRIDINSYKTPPTEKYNLSFTDGEVINMLITSAGKLHYHDGSGKLVPKQELTFSADTRVFVADGKDEVTVTIEGIPADRDSVDLKVGAVTIAHPRGEVLTITKDAPGIITVNVADFRFIAESLVLTGR